MKLTYTKKELKKLGWATIGGRIEDYSLIAWLQGKEKAYKAIKKDYGKDNVNDVFRGLIVYTEFNIDAYYTPNNL